MITYNSKRFWLALFLGLCLGSGTGAYAQQRFGGTFGGGNFGGNTFRPGGSSSSSSSSSSSTSGQGYPNATTIGPATITIDPDTRRVIVITDDATWTNVSTVISNLDRPKPQVLIKVVFLEVTHDDALDFGIEGQYTHAPSFATNLSLVQNFNLGPQGINPSIIGGNTMPVGAGLYSIMTQDYQVTLRAIASAGKTEVLSRPSVMVRNNQPANITVGQSIPLVTSVTYNTINNQPISTISYQNVGIILQVTPFISPDGLVEMIVAPQISSLSSQTVPVAPGFNAPAIDVRSASTVVVTPDGQTAVIGGLMEHDKATVDTKIPILGDIPGLGVLFRRKQKDNTKKELLIFLTPHIVTMPSELASTYEHERGNIELSPKAFPENELNRYLDTLPLKQPSKSGNH